MTVQCAWCEEEKSGRNNQYRILGIAGRNEKYRNYSYAMYQLFRLRDVISRRRDHRRSGNTAASCRYKKT